MCKCTPNIKSPFCGGPGCESPGSEFRVVYSALEAEHVFRNRPHIGIVLCLKCGSDGGPWKFCTDVADALGFYNSPNPGPTPDEWDVLWHWHHDEKHRCAERQEYADAQHHKERQAAIRPLTTFGRPTAAKEAS